jgi:hypothetical protein
VLITGLAALILFAKTREGAGILKEQNKLAVKLEEHLKFKERLQVIFFKKSFYKMAGCGHPMRLGNYTLNADGKSRNRYSEAWMELSHCPRCLEKLVFPCGRCGETIFPGDQVFLYKIPMESALPEGAKTYDGMLIGCSVGSCWSTEAIDDGFLQPDGSLFKINIYPLANKTKAKTV